MAARNDAVRRAGGTAPGAIGRERRFAAERPSASAAGDRPAADASRIAGRPLEYDEAGFPIPQRMPSFTERVRRLLTG